LETSFFATPKHTLKGRQCRQQFSSHGENGKKDEGVQLLVYKNYILLFAKQASREIPKLILRRFCVGTSGLLPLGNDGTSQVAELISTRTCWWLLLLVLLLLLMLLLVLIHLMIMMMMLLLLIHLMLLMLLIHLMLLLLLLIVMKLMLVVALSLVVRDRPGRGMVRRRSRKRCGGLMLLLHEWFSG
jgi:hypothetical protein